MVLSRHPAGSRVSPGLMDALVASLDGDYWTASAVIVLRAFPDATEVELAEVSVAEDLWRQGIAAALVGWFREQVLGLGLDATVIMDWDPGNPGGMAFWTEMEDRFGMFDETDMPVSDPMRGTWKAP